MAFEDSNEKIQERQERERQIKRRMIATLISIVILLLVAALCSILYKSTDHPQVNEEPPKEGHISESIRSIKTLCEGTDYREVCENSLENAIILDHSMSALHPVDILKMAISVIDHEVDTVVTEIEKLKYETTMTKAGFEVCFQVLNDAKEEVNSSITSFSNIQVPDLNNWLSAVMSYQETCKDALTYEAKSFVGSAIRKVEELTSNSLAIVSQIASMLPDMLQSTISSSTNFDRHLLNIDEDTDVPKWNPDVIVAKDGSGNYTTISNALEKLPNYKGRYVIYVKEGIYEENVVVGKRMVNITMYGDGSEKTIVTGNKSYDDGIPTYQTATFAAVGKGFIAQSIGFTNTAGPEKNKAVALRVQSDHSIFINCSMKGFQDTLYAQTHRQFYKGCNITGTTDFIFGDAAAIFQNCSIYIIRKPPENETINVITSQERASKRETTGFVLHNCRVLADETLAPETYKSYLGRAVKDFSRTVVMETEISNVIDPEGWLLWNKTSSAKTVYYAEYKNTGEGAVLNGRTKFPEFRGEIDRETAEKFTVGDFIQGEYWLKNLNLNISWGLNS